ncbi:adenylyltransferase/cytidyltransferase family protein [Butyrivibrio sp. AE2032]|uniref:adenylyltransferase/cytidyltransferase family protein n=1 Tax=Butyrivibrio sp. AE2032 TaxID=1458463 RepID=UPI000ADAB04C|nr:adenylyltransferase/cytidyltransferase family protein [Butyrivibrio sp. AE2032]
MANSLQEKELQKGLVAWYDFRSGTKVLYIGGEEDPIAEYLMSQSVCIMDEDGRQIGKNLSVSVVPLAHAISSEFCESNKAGFDYIISIEGLELEADIASALTSLRSLLTPEGILLLGMNNRMGIRYFCGDRDKYTDRNFDGVENYRRAYMKKEDVFRGRMYAKFEMEEMLDSAGFGNGKFYSVLNNLQEPNHLIAFGYVPNEDLANRLYPSYYYPNTVFLEEETLYKSLFANGMFHEMANAYMVEVPAFEGTELLDYLEITVTMERNRKDAMATIIRENKTVLKKNMYPEGRERFEDMLEYASDLRAHGLKVIDMELTESGLSMPYIDAPTGQLYLKELMQKDKDKFYDAFDHFIELVRKSSDVISGTDDSDLGEIYCYGYPDLVPLNSFYIDGDFVFFDQEFRKERYSIYAVEARCVTTLYFGNGALDKIVSKESLYDRYGLLGHIKDWQRMEWKFLSPLRNEGALGELHRKTRRNANIVNSNRQRMNYPEEDYYKLFVNIFEHCDTRKLILFGSGQFADRFMTLYSEDYPVYAVLDNQEKRWGKKLHDVEIQSPELLRKLSIGEYKVLICIKNYVSVIKQLEEMGVKEYSVYDPARSYPRKRKPTFGEVETLPPHDPKKKYHVGYISGVFDLYHVGHLNLFKNAKELCDYLIVGVVSDKGVIKHKGVSPFVPFEERAELVRSCRYVDEVVEIPLDLNGPKEAYSLYHFDVQFSGSDYINSDYWLNAQEYLRQRGSDLYFFPYTKSTNSTNIKALIEKKLIDD